MTIHNEVFMSHPIIDQRLREAGFKPTKLAKLTTYNPALPAPPKRPGFIAAALDAEGLAEIPRGLIESKFPAVASRIKLLAESIRLVGVPIMVVFIDATPRQEASTDA